MESQTPIQPPARPTGKRVGAPKGNRNSLQHGVRAFTLGRFPAGGVYVARMIHALRRQLEAEILARDGAIGIFQAACVNSACRHEGAALLLARWLRVEGESLPVLDKANLLERIGRSTDSRDRCLKTLGLDARPRDLDPWAALSDASGQPAQAALLVPAGQPADAPDAQPDPNIIPPVADAPASLAGGQARRVAQADCTSSTVAEATKCQDGQGSAGERCDGPADWE